MSNVRRLNCTVRDNYIPLLQAQLKETESELEGLKSLMREDGWGIDGE